MTNGQQITGTRDEHYNLVSVLYHTLQEGETIERYIDDARRAGDDELAGFFQEVQEQDRERAEASQEAAHRARHLGALPAMARASAVSR